MNRNREYQKRWRKANPATYTTAKIRWFERHAAEMHEDKRQKRCRYLRSNATRFGLLARPDHCEKCSCECKPQGHHENYTKPLSVEWLCRDCHIKADKARAARLGIVRQPPRQHKLTEYQRRAIFELWATGRFPQTVIAKLVGCTNGYVSRLVRGVV